MPQELIENTDLEGTHVWQGGGTHGLWQDCRIVLGDTSISILSRDPDLSSKPSEPQEKQIWFLRKEGWLKRMDKESTPSDSARSAFGEAPALFHGQLAPGLHPAGGMERGKHRQGAEGGRAAHAEGV